MQKTHSLSFLEHWLEYLLLLAAVAGVAYFLVQWALPNIAGYVASHLLLVSALGIVALLGCTAHRTVPALWRGYRAINNHKIENRERSAYIALLEAAKAQMEEGYNINLKNSKTGDELGVLNPYVQGRGAGHVSIHEIEQILDKRLAIAAPKEEEQEQIPDVVEYKDIAREVPAELSLLGVHPDTGHLEIVSPDQYKTTLFLGGSNTGKTNTVYGKVGDAVRWGAGLLICDKHGRGNKKDSLTNQLKDFHPYLIDKIAATPEQIKSAILKFAREFKARENGTSTSEQKWLIVIDELNSTSMMTVEIDADEAEALHREFGVNLNNNKGGDIKLEVFIKMLVKVCGYEARGFGMFGYFISQQVAGFSWLRNAAMTVFVHGLLMESEAKLAANNNPVFTKMIMNFKKGRTLVYGYEIDQPMILQQPLYNPQKPQVTIIDQDTDFYSGQTERLESLPMQSSGPQTVDAGRSWEEYREDAQEAAGRNTQENGAANQLELKRLFADIGKMKAKGMSNDAILKELNLTPGGRNNQNLKVTTELISAYDEAEGA